MSSDMNKYWGFIQRVKSIVFGIWFLITLPFRIVGFLWSIAAGPFRYLWQQISKRLRVSITFKTTSMYAVIFSLLLFIGSLALTGVFGLFLAIQTQITLENKAKVIAYEIKQNAVVPVETITAYAEMEDIQLILLDKTGKILYAYPVEAVTRTTLSGRPFLGTGPNGVPGVWFDDRYQFMNLRVYPEAGNDVYEIQLSQAIHKEKIYLAILLLFLGLFSMLAVLFAAIIGYWNGRKMLKPIDNMTRTARSISASDLRTRLDVVRSHDELKDLAETFNQMLDRIEASYDQQKQFVSDASHELRTPISVIQGYANLLRRWGKDDQAVLEEAVNAIASETEHMKDLIEKLLFLARAEQATQAIVKTTFAMDELIQEVVTETALVDSEHTLVKDANESTVIYADRQLIKQVLRIFLDNSIKYTPAGGQITISNRRRGDKLQVTVQDTGAGIAPEELPYIFDRFYRCDKSRTRQTGGTGLGLAIAKWIIEKHDGTIRVDSTVDQGTSVIVNFPLG